jgi:hypothetical protein
MIVLVFGSATYGEITGMAGSSSSNTYGAAQPRVIQFALNSYFSGEFYQNGGASYLRVRTSETNSFSAARAKAIHRCVGRAELSFLLFARGSRAFSRLTF